MISNQQQQYQRQFLPLDQLPQGTGNSGRYVKEVTGVLIGIEPRDGEYEITDSRTGQKIRRPNSWTAHFADGSMFSWPTYRDPSTGRVMMWSRFDSSIDLAVCIQQGIPLHVWRDERNFTHLELVHQQVVENRQEYYEAAPWA